MLPRSKLRHHPAERLMHIDLRRDDRRKYPATVLYNGGRGFITRCLYSKNQHTPTVSRVRLISQNQTKRWRFVLLLSFLFRVFFLFCVSSCDFVVWFLNETTKSQ